MELSLRPNRRPNVVWILTDQLRSHALGSGSILRSAAAQEGGGPHPGVATETTSSQEPGTGGDAREGAYQPLFAFLSLQPPQNPYVAPTNPGFSPNCGTRRRNYRGRKAQRTEEHFRTFRCRYISPSQGLGAESSPRLWKPCRSHLRPRVSAREVAVSRRAPSVDRIEE